MAKLVYVYGKSGSGKSRSLKNFGSEEIFYINTIGKDLPFRNKFKYSYVPLSVSAGQLTVSEKVMRALQKMPDTIKTVVIDDAGYIMSDMFMNGHSLPRKGATSFDLYNDIADSFYRILQYICFVMPNDVIVYILMHEERTDFGETKFLTIGKLLDQKVCLEGMATVVLRCVCEGNEHFFRTQTDGLDLAKSPEDMFSDNKIENDLKAVDTIIREFYGINTKEAK